MAVVLRLQGLNNAAGCEDIRRFFHGLSLPKGCVHITGGDLGEAFIIFSTKRAGELAMLHSGKPLRGSVVTLHKSSLAELKHRMELKLKKRKCADVESKSVAPTTAAAVLYTTLLQGLVAAVQELQSDQQTNQSPAISTTQLPDKPTSGTNVKLSPKADEAASVINQAHVAKAARHVEEQQSSVREVGSCKPGYLRLYGLPPSITEHEVCQFLNGIKVMDVIPDTCQGPDRCCLVKTASFKEAEKGLNYSSASQRDFQVEVRLAHERMWENAKQHLKTSALLEDRDSPEKRLYRCSPVKRACSPGASPKHHRPNPVSFKTDYCVMVKNLPTTITKTRIRDMFSCHDLPNSKILHLLNKQRERTSTAFVIFTQPEDYTLAMNMNGSLIGSQIIDVSSITMEKMNDLLHHNRSTELEGSPTFCLQPPTVLSCVYARNFPADVRKAEVKSFFKKYQLNYEDVELLKDENGNGIGEAVIHFGCEDRAREALGLHGERFEEDAILLACISTKQMKDLLQTAR